MAQEKGKNTWGPVEIFRAGNYGAKGTFSEDDLQEIVQYHDPAWHNPPLTTNHDDKQGPYGVIAALKRTGDKLLATFSDISEAGRKWIEEHPYAKPSIELFPRTNSQTGGKLRLRAVSLVGVPQVKGLSPLPAFADDERGEYLRIDFHENLEAEEPTTMSEKNKGAQQQATAETPQEPAKTEPNAELVKMSDDLKALNARNAELERKLRKSEFDSRLKELTAKGVAPALLKSPGLFEFTESLAAGGVIKFADGDKAAELAPLDWFNKFMDGLANPALVARETKLDPHERKGAAGGDATSAKIQKFADEHKLEFHDAMTAMLDKGLLEDAEI